MAIIKTVRSKRVREPVSEVEEEERRLCKELRHMMEEDRRRARCSDLLRRVREMSENTQSRAE